MFCPLMYKSKLSFTTALSVIIGKYAMTMQICKDNFYLQISPSCKRDTHHLVKLFSLAVQTFKKGQINPPKNFTHNPPTMFM